MDKFIIKEKNTYMYFSILIRHSEKKIICITNGYQDKLNEGVERMKKYVNRGDLDHYEIVNEKIKSNFIEATELMSIVVILLATNNTFISELNLVLISDLFKEYLDQLLQNSSIKLDIALKIVGTKNSLTQIRYDEKNHDSLLFVNKIKNYKEFYSSKIKNCREYDSYIKNCNDLVKNLSSNKQLKGDEFLFLLCYISNVNDKVIDPGILLLNARQLSNLKKIRKYGKYFFPVCDQNHWVLFEVEYNRDIIKFFIYDSLKLYESNNELRDKIRKKIKELFISQLKNESVEIIDTVVEQNDNTSCGYFTLFYLGCRINCFTINKISNIESFNIYNFIDDLKSGIEQLSNDQKAKLWQFYVNKNLYKFN